MGCTATLGQFRGGAVSDAALRIYHGLPAPLRAAASQARALHLRRWRYGLRTEEWVSEALEREKWSLDRWRQWQEEQLARMLDRAATRVPYYRNAWTERRRRGDRSSWSRLENWPVLPKEAVRANPLAFVREDVQVRRLHRDHTSGSTGTPLSLLISRETLRRWYALVEARMRRWHGVSWREPWAILGGQPVVPARVRRPPFWVWNAPLHQLYLSTNHFTPERAKAYTEAMNRRGVTHSVVYPSAGVLLAEAMLAQRHSVPTMRAILSNAEPLHSWQRDLMSAAFGAPVREAYGMAEIVTAASECPQGKMHLWPEAGYLEVMADDEEISVPDGESGRLVATSLFNADMPLIRYAVGDRGRRDSSVACTCGREMPVLTHIEGRTADVLRAADGRYVHWINPVFYGLPITEGQAIQESLDHIKVLVATAEGFSASHEQLIRARMRDRLGDVRVDVARVDRVPREPNGKLKPVVSKLAAASAYRAAGESASR